MVGNQWDDLILKATEQQVIQSVEFKEEAKIRLNEKYFVYPEIAREKFCPKFQGHCKATKCIFWIRGKKEQQEIKITATVENKDYLKVWDGLTGGDEKLVKKIKTEKGWKEKTRYENESKNKKGKFKGKFIFTVHWIKESGLYKGICLYKFSLIRTVFYDKNI